MFKVLKGTSIGNSWETLRNSKTSLGNMLVSVLETLNNNEKMDNQRRISQGLPKEELTRDGKIFSYYSALVNEIHTLAIIIDMINHVISNENYLTMQVKNLLYLETLFESYIRNLRSIFDFLSIVIRVTIREEYRNRLPQRDSYNEFIKFVEKGAAKDIIPSKIIEII